MKKSVFEQLVALIAAELHKADPECDVVAGALALSAHSGTRRVVFVWEGGRLEVVSTTGSKRVGTTDFRPLLSDRARVSAHVLAPTAAAMDELACQLLVAVHAVMNTASKALEYENTTELEPAQVYGRNTARVILFEWELLIAGSRLDTKTITTVTHTCDGIDWTLPAGSGKP